MFYSDLHYMGNEEDYNRVRAIQTFLKLISQPFFSTNLITITVVQVTDTGLFVFIKNNFLRAGKVGTLEYQTLLWPASYINFQKNHFPTWWQIWQFLGVKTPILGPNVINIPFKIYSGQTYYLQNSIKYKAILPPDGRIFAYVPTFVARRKYYFS